MNDSTLLATKIKESYVDTCHSTRICDLVSINFGINTMHMYLLETSNRLSYENLCGWVTFVESWAYSSHKTIGTKSNQIRLKLFRCEWSHGSSLVGLPDHWKFFQGQFVFQRVTVSYFHGLPQGKPIATGVAFVSDPHFLCPQSFGVFKSFIKTQW